jgi:hypothetical protein
LIFTLILLTLNTMADEESLSSFHTRLLGAAVSTYVIITLLVPLKLWCRVRSGGWRNLGMDDFITVFGLLVAHAFNLICLIGKFCWNGCKLDPVLTEPPGMWPALGIHIAELMGRPDGLEIITRFLKMVFIGQLLYTFGVAVSKFAILAFYWRLFSITARIPIYIMSFIVFGWLTGIVSAHSLIWRGPTNMIYSASPSFLPVILSPQVGTSPSQRRLVSAPSRSTSEAQCQTSSQT